MCERTEKQLEHRHITPYEVRLLNSLFDDLDISWSQFAKSIDCLDYIFDTLREIRGDAETDERLAGAALEYLIQVKRIDPRRIDYKLRRYNRAAAVHANANRVYLNEQEERKDCMARHPAGSRLAVS